MKKQTEILTYNEDAESLEEEMSENACDEAIVYTPAYIISLTILGTIAVFLAIILIIVFLGDV